MIRTQAHKQNPSFQEGVQTGRIRLALELLDLIGDIEDIRFKDAVDLMQDIQELAKDQIPE
jgi:hypothetical protein